MGLDIYVGTLTRYYSGQWETIAARVAREQGWTFQTLRPDDSNVAVTDPEQIAPAVSTWRTALSHALCNHLHEPLDWPEGMAAPYFTDKPDWDGLGGLLLWAAYLEQSSLQRPTRYTKDWEHDAAFKASTAPSFRSRYMPAFTSELWLPGEPVMTFEAQDLAGKVIWMSFTSELQCALRDLNERTWRAEHSDIGVWRQNGPPNDGDTLETQARFGFAILFELANSAVENQLPMKLDY